VGRRSAPWFISGLPARARAGATGQDHRKRRAPGEMSWRTHPPRATGRCRRSS
jgi:hypothetical protein